MLKLWPLVLLAALALTGGRLVRVRVRVRRGVRDPHRGDCRDRDDQDDARSGADAVPGRRLRGGRGDGGRRVPRAFRGRRGPAGRARPRADGGSRAARISTEIRDEMKEGAAQARVSRLDRRGEPRPRSRRRGAAGVADAPDARSRLPGPGRRRPPGRRFGGRRPSGGAGRGRPGAGARRPVGGPDGARGGATRPTTSREPRAPRSLRRGGAGCGFATRTSSSTLEFQFAALRDGIRDGDPVDERANRPRATIREGFATSTARSPTPASPRR